MAKLSSDVCLRLVRESLPGLVFRNEDRELFAGFARRGAVANMPAALTGGSFER